MIFKFRNLKIFKSLIYSIVSSGNKFLENYSPKNYIIFLIYMLFLYNRVYLKMFDFEFNQIEYSFSVSFNKTSINMDFTIFMSRNSKFLRNLRNNLSINSSVSSSYHSN